MIKKLIVLFCFLLLMPGVTIANNSYFESSTYHVSDGARARASDVNNVIDSIETGFLGLDKTRGL